jgi:hypothetical protein
MPGRLGFAVAVHADADIVLIDEVLSVGDANFRERCTREMEELRDSGKTLVLVSHNMGAISTLCARTIVLDQGEVKFEGPTGDAIRFYSDLLRINTLKKIKREEQKAAIHSSHGMPKYHVWDVEVLPAPGESAAAFDARNGLAAAFSIGSRKYSGEILTFVEIAHDTGLVLVEERTRVRLPPPGSALRVTITFEGGLPLKSGSYILRAGAKDPTGVVEVGSAETSFVISTGSASEHAAIAPRFRATVEEIDPATMPARPMAVS